MTADVFTRELLDALQCLVERWQEFASLCDDRRKSDAYSQAANDLTALIGSARRDIAADPELNALMKARIL